MIYEIANLRINIQNRCRYTNEFCKEYLVVDQSSPADFSVSVTNEEFYAEKEQSKNFSDGYIENICLYRKICLQMPRYNRFLLHAAILTFDGAAYAFLGKSGIGKSTHTALWTSHINGAEILNGDKPIIENYGNNFIAYGTPWNGKENRGRKGNAPLKALCFIERSERNYIEAISIAQAADRLFTQILLPTERETAEKTLEMADRFVTNIPAYVMHCTMDVEAARVSFTAITGKSFDDYAR